MIESHYVIILIIAMPMPKTAKKVALYRVELAAHGKPWHLFVTQPIMTLVLIEN